MDYEDWKCGTCGLWFTSLNARDDHLWHFEHAEPEFECESCERFFPTLRQVEKHMNSKSHWNDVYVFECGDCLRDFSSFERREKHTKRRGHRIPDFECDTCGRVFPNKQLVEDHMDSRNHRVEVEEIESSDIEYVDEYECRLCTRCFTSEESCTKHEAKAHHYCFDCNWYFQNANDARMHRNSKRHRGTPIRCPFCNEYYSAATALCHHLERGACPSVPNLTREQIYKMVRSKDPDGIITKKLIDWHGASTTTYKANWNAWNGSAYECYLCHKKFGKLNSLNQHLSSSIHEQALYHCPKSDCRKDFTTLGALMNHLESESCGFTRFSNVQRTATNIVSSDRRISFR